MDPLTLKFVVVTSLLWGAFGAGAFGYKRGLCSVYTWLKAVVVMVGIWEISLAVILAREGFLSVFAVVGGIAMFTYVFYLIRREYLRERRKEELD